MTNQLTPEQAELLMAIRIAHQGVVDHEMATVGYLSSNIRWIKQLLEIIDTLLAPAARLAAPAVAEATDWRKPATQPKRYVIYADYASNYHAIVDYADTSEEAIDKVVDRLNTNPGYSYHWEDSTGMKAPAVTPPPAALEHRTADTELAAQGLRRADIGAGEPGWYVTTSEGQVWATDDKLTAEDISRIRNNGWLPPRPSEPLTPAPAVTPPPAPRVKLSAAQRTLLTILANTPLKRSWMKSSYRYNGGKAINSATVDYCKQHGLAVSETQVISDRRYEVLTITTAGRAALADSEAHS